MKTYTTLKLIRVGLANQLGVPVGDLDFFLMGKIRNKQGLFYCPNCGKVVEAIEKVELGERLREQLGCPHCEFQFYAM